MLTLIISLVIGGLAGYASSVPWKTGWGITIGCAAFVASQLVAGLIIRKRVMALQNNLQNIMTEGQNKLNRQMNLYRLKPPASQKTAIAELEKIQSAATRKALEATESFKPYYKWNFLLDRQINVMKVQLHYQLKEYKQVDELLKKSIIRDSQTAAIAMVRRYRAGDQEGVNKIFNRKKRLFKSDDLAFFASVYAWICLKNGNEDTARTTLLDAKKSTDNEIMLANLDKLQNAKPKHYTMNGFGDRWYALGLEEPKAQQVRQQPQRQYRYR